MAIYQLKAMLDQYAEEFLVLEINHLFVSSSLREEVWLLQKKEDAAFLQHVIVKARSFDLNEINADRNFETYSGGQKAIVACLLVMAAIENNGLRDRRVLLINVLESISSANRRLLIAEFRRLNTANGIRVYAGGPGRIDELA